MYTNGWDPNNGVIMRSTDQGATWAKTPLPFTLGGNMPGRGMGERLVIDPNKNNILFLAAPSGNGLWKSTDSGVTWSEVTSFPNAGNYVQTPGDSYAGITPGAGRTGAGFAVCGRRRRLPLNQGLKSGVMKAVVSNPGHASSPDAAIALNSGWNRP